MTKTSALRLPTPARLSTLFLAAAIAGAQFKQIGPAPIPPKVAREQIRSLLERVEPANRQQTVNSLTGLTAWYRDLLDEELIRAWQRDDRANLAAVIETLADPRVAAGIVEFSWRQRRQATFTPTYAPLLGNLMARYPDSSKPFLDDLLASTASGRPALDLSKAEAEAVCRILLDMPDIRTWKQSALQILPHYRQSTDELLDRDLHGADRNKMYRATQWVTDLAGAPAAGQIPDGPRPAAGNGATVAAGDPLYKLGPLGPGSGGGIGSGRGGAGTVGPDGLYRMGNGVSAPGLLFKSDPEYSEAARKLAVEGPVILYIVVHPDGTAHDVKILHSIGYGLDEKAIEAVRKWKFKPAMKDGVAVPVAAQVEHLFRLLGARKPEIWYPGPIGFASEAGLTPPRINDGKLPEPSTDLSIENVALSFTVDTNGSVKNIRFVNGSESGAALVTRSLATWKFQPAVKDNRAAEATGNVTFAKGQGATAAKVAPPPAPVPSPATPPPAMPSPAMPPPSAPPPPVGGTIRTAVNPTDGQKYVWIPAGAFTMGCSPGDSECAGDEKPPHAERIAAGFWLGQTEVTQAAFLRVTGGNPSAHKGDPLPVESLTWNHAANYCAAIGGRLPTEAEWEYAARAGSTWSRYGGLDAVAWHSGNSGGATHPVATKEPNAFGLYDMLGNVWEWTADNFPGTGDKVLRGGSLFYDIRATRASSRLRMAPSGAANGRGFRCVGTAPTAGERQPPVAPPIGPPPVAAAPALPARDTLVNKKDGQPYVWIPPGSFTVGCSPGDHECWDNEKPPHPEGIADGFWLGRTEVTQAAYQKVTGGNPSAHKGDQLPVENVSWQEALNYCQTIGGHLPSEIEWEYAARGSAGVSAARYGNLGAVAWFSANSGGTTHPVAQKTPNAFGLYDMLGNVWEWVEDSYSGAETIERGGAWDGEASHARASRRAVAEPAAASPSTGFRCAGEWPAEEKMPPASSAMSAPPTAGPGGMVSPGVYRTGGDITPPALLRKVEPQYSEEARKAKFEGTVLLYFQIDPSGKAINMRVLRPLGMGLDEKAMEAVRKWKFKPSMKDGKPVTVECQAEVNFRLL